MTNKQQQCYDKAMRAFSNVFQMLCNANGPLPSPDEQSKVLKILGGAKDKINALIKKNCV